MLEFQIRKQNPGRQRARAQAASREANVYVGCRRRNACSIAWGDQRRACTMTLRETIERITAILGELGLRFHFTGGVAASFYGDPRFTQDLDLVIRTDQRSARDQVAPEPPLVRILHRMQQAIRDAIDGKEPLSGDRRGCR